MRLALSFAITAILIAAALWATSNASSAPVDYSHATLLETSK